MMTNIREKTLLFLVAAILASNTFSQSQNEDSTWRTAAELSNYAQTPRYNEVIAFSKRLDAQSDQIVFKSFGKSSEGRDLPLLIAASDGEFSPHLAVASQKAVVLIQAAIHAGESDGKDAGLALFRDIALKKLPDSLLDNVILLFIPIYNVDGHELFSKFNRINQNGPEKSGFRANSANQNLNRDYIKADTVETRSWLRLWNEWNPDFFIDCHVTDGADFQYNITYEFAHHGEVDPTLSGWMAKHFEGTVIRNVEKEGHLLSRYIQMADRFDPAKGIFSFIATPRFATGYTPIRNRIGLLIEAHSVKPYETRVKGTYSVLKHMITELSANKDSLVKINKVSDREFLDREPAVQLVLSQKIGNEKRDFLFKGFESEVDGESVFGGALTKYTTKPKTSVIPQYDTAETVLAVDPPDYYVLPPQWSDVIDRLDAHGVRYSRTTEPMELQIKSYKFKNPKWGTNSFEGRLTLAAETEEIEETRLFPAKSLIIPYRQMAGRVAAHFLEPIGPDSAFYWGFFNAIFEQKEYSETYVLEEIAREMLKNDDALKKEYEAELKDPKFAASKQARQRFFYVRSPYYDKRIGLYPVGRAVDKATILKLQKHFERLTQ